MKHGKLAMMLLVSGTLSAPTQSSIAQEDLWVSAYYAGWMAGHLPPDQIDFEAITHLLHFAVMPTYDGGLEPNGIPLTPPEARLVVQTAHRAGKKVLLVVGGWWTRDRFEASMKPRYRGKLVSNLMEFLRVRGYDGFDIDMEDIWPENRKDFQAFVRELRDSMDTHPTRLVLSCAVKWTPEIFAEIHHLFDHINMMTYDMAGAYEGWVTWHNAPIFDSGHVLPTTKRPLPSANRDIDKIVALGVPAEKLSVGIDFYGYVWSGGAGTSTGGATGPLQRWTTPPHVQDNVAYFKIMSEYYHPSLERWDPEASAVYLSIDKPGSKDDKFISYENERAIREKISFAREKGIGGLLIWELGGGYMPEQPAGRRDPLLQAVKAAVKATSGVAK